MNRDFIYIPLLVVFALTTLSGCATTGHAASAIPGCGPKDIKISNHKAGLFTETFTATCKGKSYSCQIDNNGSTQCSSND